MPDAGCGEWLGAMWGNKTTQEMLKDAGFKSVVIKQLDHDFQNDYYVISKS